jgi:hypothetical protein
MTRSAQIPTQFSMQGSDERIEAYLNRLEELLADMTPEDKEDTLCEIRAHILDSTTGAMDRDAAVDRVLRLLGTPEELAARYNTERMLTRAARSFSPWVLLRTCWRWATVGMKGTLAFLFALFGYGTALALTVSVFLKPIVPTVGLWLGPHSLHVGNEARTAGTHELLGPWFVPVIAVIAFAAAVGTTQGLRWMIRTRKPAPDRAVRSSNLVGSAVV